jgi:hypothetical protein
MPVELFDVDPRLRRRGGASPRTPGRPTERIADGGTFGVVQLLSGV